MSGNNIMTPKYFHILWLLILLYWEGCIMYKVKNEYMVTTQPFHQCLRSRKMFASVSRFGKSPLSLTLVIWLSGFVKSSLISIFSNTHALSGWSIFCSPSFWSVHGFRHVLRLGWKWLACQLFSTFIVNKDSPTSHFPLLSCLVSLLFLHTL